MVVATLILAVVLALAATAWVVWPLLNRTPAPVLVEDDGLADLLGRKDAVVSAIRDLEFDFKLGKLSEEDFQRYNDSLRRQAVALLQQIEQVAPASIGLDATVEAEVMRRRRMADGVQAPAHSRPVAVPAGAAVATGVINGIAPRPASVKGSARRKYCTECGSPLEAHHRFCAKCGTPVQQVADPVAPVVAITASE